MKFRIPHILIICKFSDILMAYFFLYRESNCRSFLHGKELQSKQYFPFRCIQERIVQFLLHFLSGDQHPSHLFFCRRKARQIAQFMPQGAMSFVFMKVFKVMGLFHDDLVYKNIVMGNFLKFFCFTLILPKASSIRYILPALPVSSLQPARVHHHGARKCRTPRWSPLQEPAHYRYG